MPLKVACPCGKSLTVPESLAGKRGRCPHCKKALPIPPATPKPEPEVFGLAPVSEPAKKVEPLLFDVPKVRERCEQCGTPIADGDVLCDGCAGKKARKGAKIAARNMQGPATDPTGQPGYGAARQLLAIVLVPLYIVFYPLLLLIAMAFPWAWADDSGTEKAESDDDE